MRGRLITKDINGFEFYQVMEHIEVYRAGEFVVSADTLREAEQELLDLC